MLDREREALLALTLVPGLGPILTRRCVDVFGSAEAALGATIAELAQVKGIGRKVARWQSN